MLLRIGCDGVFEIDDALAQLGDNLYASRKAATGHTIDREVREHQESQKSQMSYEPIQSRRGLFPESARSCSIALDSMKDTKKRRPWRDIG